MDPRDLADVPAPTRRCACCAPRASRPSGKRHHATAERVRDGLEALGLELYAAEGFRSDTVTAMLPPEGLAADEIRAIARTDFDTVFAGGQASLGGQIMRFGHLGYTTGEDVSGALEALRGSLAKLGHAVPAAAGG